MFSLYIIVASIITLDLSISNISGIKALSTVVVSSTAVFPLYSFVVLIAAFGMLISF